MQAIELVVFFMVSVVIGGMILLFIGNIDIDAVYDSINRVFFPDTFDPENLNKVTKLRFPGLLGDCWAECEFGLTPKSCGSVYITDPDNTGSITLAEVEEIFEKYSFCTDCNVSMPSINLPSVVGVECTETELVVST